jgi:hypothetical protein
MTLKEMLIDILGQIRRREEKYQRDLGNAQDDGARQSIKAHLNELRDIRGCIFDPLLAQETKAETEAKIITRPRGAGGRSETERYELVYGLGGHGGPYVGYTAALEAAK